MKYLRIMELFLYSFIMLCLTSDAYSYTQDIIYSATRSVVSEELHPDLYTADGKTSDWLVPSWMENVLDESHNQSPLSSDTLTAQGAIPPMITDEELEAALAEIRAQQEAETVTENTPSEPQPEPSPITETEAVSEVAPVAEPEPVQEVEKEEEKSTGGPVIDVKANYVAGSTTTSAERNYSYGNPVSASASVSDSFFSNTAIIGDSRSQGLMSFGGMPGKDMTYVGLSVYNIDSQRFVNGNLTVLEALAQGNYDRVYIGLGLNCIGYPSSSKFTSLYSAFIDDIRKINPNMEIYVQNIFPVNEPLIYSRGTSSYINNASIREFNTLIQNLAKSKKLHYLDLYSYFADSSGELPASASTDGLHFGSEYSRKWTEYIRSHTISW